MIPFRDNVRCRTTPVVTVSLIIVNSLVFFYELSLGSETQAFLSRYGVTPSNLVQWPASGQSFASVGIPYLTSMFLHGGWFHLIGNMWFLWIFGDNVEDAMGTARFVAFYLVCGLAAAALQVAMGPDSIIPMVGASGAIGGVMGAYIVLYPRVHVHMLVFLGFFITTFAVPAVFMLAYWLLIQLVSGLFSLGAEGGGVAFWAHVGGFVGGMALIFMFRNQRLLARHPYHGWRQTSSPTRSWRRIDRR